MIIDQAFFGNKNGSHNVLYSTLDNQAIIGKLKPLTDKPESIDIEYPYLSGYRINEYYVLSQTTKDSAAKRGGMVFTHCFIIAIQNIAFLNNLEMLFGYFSKEVIHDFTNIQTIKLEEQGFIAISKPEIYGTLTHYLLKNKKTVIYLGYEHFESCIIHLWQNLPLSLRLNFSFTIAGTPNEIQNENYTLTLIHTPLAHQNKWANFPVIRGIESNIDKSLAYSFLYETNSEERMTFNQFVRENEIELGKIADLSDINKCIGWLNKVDNEINFQNLRNLIPLVVTLLPNPNKGKILKENILEKLIRESKNATIANIKSLRNITIESFEGGQQSLELAVQKWVAKNICTTTIVPLKDLSESIRDVFERKELDWCSKIIKNYIETFCGQIIATNQAQFIWSIWEKEVELIFHLEKHISQEKEQLFFNSFPQNGEGKFYTAIASLALSKQWFSIYALANIQLFEVKETVELQLKNDLGSSLENNLFVISQKVDKKELVLVAANINNSSLHKVAGKVCSEHTRLLQHIEIGNMNWQEIWYAYYSYTKDINKGIANIQGIFYQLLNLILKRESIKQELIILIETVITSIYDYPERAEIWQFLPITVKNSLLDKTAVFIFEKHNEIELSSLEPDLMQTLQSSNFISHYVISSKNTFRSKMEFLKCISMLSEHYAIEILRSNPNLSEFDASYLSEIIQDRKMEKVLNYVYKEDRMIAYSKSILQRCKNMLDFIQRFWLSGGQKLTSIEDIGKMLDNGDWHKVFNILDKHEHKGSIYKDLKDEYIGGYSKAKDLHDLAKRLKVYILNLK